MGGKDCALVIDLYSDGHSPGAGIVLVLPGAC